MKLIPLVNGGEAIVDDEDYESLSAYKWYAYHAYSTTYARRYVNIRKGKHSIRMHRVIMGAPDDLVVDHINHNGLDNRRSNLRICTHSQNQRNRAGNPKYGYWGIQPSREHWRAYLWIGRELKHLGVYPTREQAAYAYNLAVIEAGLDEFANLNDVAPQDLTPIHHTRCRASGPSKMYSKQAGTSSRYLGVSRSKVMPSKPWQAKLRKVINGQKKNFWLGLFATEEEAAAAYQAKYRELAGKSETPSGYNAGVSENGM